MTTLFDVALQTARELEALHAGEATGGSTTTIIDSLLPLQNWKADYWKGGSAFIIRDAAGAGAAPEKESRVITDYTVGGTFTVSPAFSTAPAAGDVYGVTTRRFPREVIFDKINAALKELGDVPTEDTTLTTAGSMLEYTLPKAAKMDLRQVWLARNTADPYDWTQWYNVKCQPSAPNQNAKLVFSAQPPIGVKIKLVYMAPHPLVYLDSSVISEYISDDWLALAAAVKTCRFRLEDVGEDAKRLTTLLNDLMQREAMARRRRMRSIPATQAVLPNW